MKLRVEKWLNLNFENKLKLNFSYVFGDGMLTTPSSRLLMGSWMEKKFMKFFLETLLNFFLPNIRNFKLVDQILHQGEGLIVPNC